MSDLINILSIYFFVAIGYFAKRMFGSELNEKSIVKLNIYFMLPMLSFWGLMSRKIDFSVIKAPIVYITVSLLSLMISITISKKNI